MDFVVIVMLNYVYFLVVKVVLEVGFYVLLDKFVMFNLEEVIVFWEIVVCIGKVYGLMYIYFGYFFVGVVCLIVVEGGIGIVCKVFVEYI